MAKSEEDIARLRQTLDLILPALEILDGFNHRNKNQHRLSKWWAEFGILRRQLGKLFPELQANLEKLERFAKYKKQPPKGVYDAEVKARVAHVQVQILPRAFLSFSQLAADNQYAHLGLALLGVLAQVDAALVLLAPRDITTDFPVPEQETAPTAAEPGKQQVVHLASEDMGVVVPRDEVATQSKPKRRPSPPGKDVRQDKPAAETSEAKPSKKQKKKQGDEFDALFGSLEPKKPKKKKRKKGDEFDDLFGSLV